MTATRVDALVAQLARRQHGVFSRTQVLSCGGSARMIDRRLASRWMRLASGVYVLPGNPPTWFRQLKAAELALPGCAVSGLAAAALHGFTGCNRTRPEVTVQPSANHRNPLATVHQRTGVERCVVEGITVVSATQTLFDIADRLPARALTRALDDALLTNMITMPRLKRRMAELAGSRRPGLALLADLIEERSDGPVPPNSELEARLFELLDPLGLPPIVRQAPLPWRPSAPQRVDATIVEWRTIIEADGRRWHTRVADFDRDARRRNEAVVRGWRHLHFTWFQITRRPGTVVNTLLDLRSHLAA
ncbi:DUF559 domain-containing protein [soil metagenome]